MIIRILRTLPFMALLVVSACATGTTTVIEPTTQQLTVKSLRFVAAKSTVNVPPDIAAHFGTRLREYLISNGKYGTGNDLTLRYRFIQVDEGSRALRYLIGFGAGKGQLTVEIVYLDASGNEVSKINVGGEISVGFFGGDFDEAISNAAREAADYTISNFPARGGAAPSGASESAAPTGSSLGRTTMATPAQAKAKRTAAVQEARRRARATPKPAPKPGSRPTEKPFSKMTAAELENFLVGKIWYGGTWEIDPGGGSTKLAIKSMRFAPNSSGGLVAFITDSKGVTGKLSVTIHSSETPGRIQLEHIEGTRSNIWGQTMGLDISPKGTLSGTRSTDYASMVSMSFHSRYKIYKLGTNTPKR